MTDEDIEWLADLLEESSWLFYGEFEEYLDDWLSKVVRFELRNIGFDKSFPLDFHVAYWAILSELVSLDLVDYGTSPRGAWWTEKGERFRGLVLSDDHALRKAAEFTHRKYNPDDSSFSEDRD